MPKYTVTISTNDPERTAPATNTWPWPEEFDVEAREPRLAGLAVMTVAIANGAEAGVVEPGDQLYALVHDEAGVDHVLPVTVPCETGIAHLAAISAAGELAGEHLKQHEVVVRDRGAS